MPSPLDRIAEFIARHHMFRAGHRVGVAVSGGADSVFLLHALHELAPRWNLQLSAVHIEHGIRGAASLADADFTRALAASFGLPFHLHRATVAASDDNLEQAARRVRQGFYGELLLSGRLDRIATGHTRSDQAETVLYRILRGSGLAGLAAIRPVTKEGLVRPLLEATRGEVQTWLRLRNIEWREDQSNQDRSFARNRIRHDILPQLGAAFNARLEEALANLATLAQDEESYWESELDRWQATANLADPLVIHTSLLASAPPALARRLIRRIVQLAKGDLRQIDFAHVERILDMARSAEGHDRVQIPSLDVFRSFDWIRFAPPRTGVPRPDFCLPLAAPGSVELPGACARITLQVLEKPETAQPYVTLGDELDWQRILSLGDAVSSLELRNWRPGDQYQPVGQSKAEKIKLMFQDARVPLWERRNWPIIAYNGVILWARRFGAAAEFAAGAQTRIVLRIAESGRQVSHRSGH